MDRQKLDCAIARLQGRKTDWARLPLSEKIHHLGELRRRTGKVAKRWVTAAAYAKRIPLGSPLLGEEWAGGPWALLHGINRYVETLVTLEEGGDLLKRTGKVRTLENGQLAVEVFPLNTYERLLFSGIRGEVWMEPGITQKNLRNSMARFYQQARPEGSVSLVLGAGNVASITPMDMLHKLYAEGSVAMVKMNPVNDYLGPIFEQIFEVMIAYGFVEFAYGGAEVGEYLVHHPGVESVHMTGSARTHDAIVFGSGPEGARRKAANQPILHKPVTSELGNVTPTIIVPGPWSDADLRFHAENIFTQKMQNGGFNCVAAQVLITPGEWALTDKLLYHLRAVTRSEPPRYPYYPGAGDRWQRMVESHPGHVEMMDPSTVNAVPRTLLTELDPNGDHPIFREEAFCGVMGHVHLGGDNPSAFLNRAVDFCNDQLSGTLAANLIIHPQTMWEYEHAFTKTLHRLRYGTIGVNIWAGSGFMLSQMSWGAFPGHTLDDVGSGMGAVHNTFLFEQPQKSICYGNFAAFPHSLSVGERHILPKPPWFATHRHNHTIGWRMAAFTENPGMGHLPGLFIDALRG
jgi:aldehyde dehydrogenase (NAD(P)+)